MSATRPCSNKKFYIYSDGTHTHPPPTHAHTCAHMRKNVHAKNILSAKTQRPQSVSFLNFRRQVYAEAISGPRHVLGEPSAYSNCPVFLFTNLFNYPIYPIYPIYLFTILPFSYLPISLFTYLPIYLVTYLRIYLSTDLPIYLSIYLSIHLSIYVPIYLSINLSIYLSIYLSIQLSICLSIFLSIYLSNSSLV